MACIGFPGVRLPCGRNVEKKFLVGVVAVLTARWLVTKSLQREKKKGSFKTAYYYTESKQRDHSYQQMPFP